MGKSEDQQELLGCPRNMAACSDQDSTTQPAHLVWLGKLLAPAANWLAVARAVPVTSPSLPKRDGCMQSADWGRSQGRANCQMAPGKSSGKC